MLVLRPVESRTRWLTRGLCLFFSSALGIFPAAPLLATAPVESFGALPSLENVQISPDGGKLAFVRTIGGSRMIVIQDLDGKVLGRLRAGNDKIRELVWAGPTHLLIMTSLTTVIPGVEAPVDEWYALAVYNLTTNTSSPVLSNRDHSQLERLNFVDGAPIVRSIAGKTIVFVPGIFFENNSGKAGLFRIDLESGSISLADAGAKNTYDWIVDNTGTPVARADYDSAQGHWSLDLKQQGRWIEKASFTADIEHPDLLGVGPNGGDVLIDKGVGNDEQVISINLVDGSSTGKFSEGGYQRYIEDPQTHRVIGAESIDETFDLTFFDPKDKATWEGIKRAYPNENVRLVSWSDDRRKIVVRVDGVLDGAAFALVDLASGKASWIGDLYDNLKLEDMSPVQAISYEAADGLKIKAFLTLPKGRTAKNLPLVVLPHGGPASRDDPGFDWWAQALANEGYAVLQPQFRGSQGFGWEFLSAGFGQWGRKMQTDLSDGVRFLAKSQTIDPSRTCIVGASYGGYAAMAGATLDPGVYRCAVAVSGIADLHRFLTWERDREGRGDTSTQRYWSRFLGAQGLNDPELSKISPITHVDRVKIPILFIHGRDDTVVDYDQSVEMYDALRRANKPAKFLALDEEDHWLSREPTRVQMLKATVEFLKLENPPVEIAKNTN